MILDLHLKHLKQLLKISTKVTQLKGIGASIKLKTNTVDIQYRREDVILKNKRIM